MTLYDELFWRAFRAVRASVHAGFSSPGQFLSMTLDEKLEVLTEPPHKKLPRMIDAADEEFWK